VTDPTANEHPLPEPASPSAPDHGQTPTELVPVGDPIPTEGEPPIDFAATPPTFGVTGVLAPTPAVPSAPSPTRRRPNIGDAILVVGVVAAIAAIGFAAGRLTGPATTGGRTVAVIPNGGFGGGAFGNGGPFQGGSGNGGQGGLRGGTVGRGLGAGVGIQGTVGEVASDHLTLTLASGQTVRIPIDPATQYHRQSGASASDVTTGSQVLVQLGQGRVANTVPNAGGGRTLPAAGDITIVGQ
jgi:hypothetical protein